VLTIRWTISGNAADTAFATAFLAPVSRSFPRSDGGSEYLGKTSCPSYMVNGREFSLSPNDNVSVLPATLQRRSRGRAAAGRAGR